MIRLKINYGGEDYVFDIERAFDWYSFKSDLVELSVLSGENKGVNLDLDGHDDVFIEVFEGRVLAKSVDVYVEKWECSGWGSCIGGEEIKVCVDLNFCGSLIDFSGEFRNC